MGNLVGLEIDFDERSLQRNAVDVNAAGEPGPVHAVIGRIGKSAVNAHLLRQLKLQVGLVAERSRSVWFERDRDEVKVALGAAGELEGKPPLGMKRLCKSRDLAGEVDGVAGAVPIELGDNNGCRVRLPAVRCQQVQPGVLSVGNAELNTRRIAV